MIKKNYKSSLKLVSISNTKQFLEMQTAGPGCATSSASLISLPSPPPCSLLGSGRVRKFILTECLFSFEHMQLISQKALFWLSPFGRKIRKKVGQKAEGGTLTPRLTRRFEYTLNSSRLMNSLKIHPQMGTLESALAVMAETLISLVLFGQVWKQTQYTLRVCSSFLRQCQCISCFPRWILQRRKKFSMNFKRISRTGPAVWIANQAICPYRITIHSLATPCRQI